MSEIRNGKRSVSQRIQRPLISPGEVFMNRLGLDPDMTKAIESKGYAYRFINYKQFVEMGGQHDAYWTPVSRKQLKEFGYDRISLGDFQEGSSPDGFIRRGDLVLAIRSKEIHEKHKAYLKQEADAATAAVSQSRRAEELRRHSKAHGIEATITEGYEDSDE